MEINFHVVPFLVKNSCVPSRDRDWNTVSKEGEFETFAEPVQLEMLGQGGIG